MRHTPTTSPPSPFLRTFGAPSLLSENGEPVALRKKDLALLVFLRAQPGTRFSRGQLAALCWGDSPEEKARHSLSQSVSRLQRALPPATLSADAGTVSLVGSLASDLELPAAEPGASGEPGAPLPTLEFLAGFAPGAGAGNFEEWADGKRAELRAAVLRRLEEEGRGAERRGDWPAALRLAQQAVRCDPLYEQGHRRILRAWAALGERNRALQHHDELVEWLDREIGGACDAETTELARQIRAGEVSAPVAGPVGPPSASTLMEGASVEQSQASAEHGPATAAPAETSRAARLPAAVPARVAELPRARARRRWPAAAAVLAGTGALAFAVHALSPRLEVAPAAAGEPLPSGLPPACQPSEAVARLVGETHPDGVVLQPNQRFVKEWTLRNTASCTWTPRFALRFESSAALPLSPAREEVRVERPVPPGGHYTIRLPMRAPAVAGTYREDWSLRDAGGRFVQVSSSNTLWAVIAVRRGKPPVCTADNAVAKLAGETYTDGASVAPGTEFIKQWRVRNGGGCSWGPDFVFRHASHDPQRLSGRVSRVTTGREVLPGEVHTFTVPMRAPRRGGTYREDWYLSDASGDTIRISATPAIWVKIEVPSTP